LAECAPNALVVPDVSRLSRSWIAIATHTRTECPDCLAYIRQFAINRECVQGIRKIGEFCNS
jgi:hypothetical protein